MGAVPAQATIVSRAHASILPSFPRRGPLSLLVAAATALLALTYVLARELIGAPAVARDSVPAAEPRLRMRRRRAPEPAAASAAAVPVAQAAPPATPMPTTPATSARKPEPAPALNPEPKIAVTAQAAATQPELPLTATAAAIASTAAADAPQSQSAAGFLQRLRRGLSSGAGEPETAPVPVEGWLGRIQRHRPVQENTAELKQTAPAAPRGGNLPVRTNDLRAYLNQRLALSKAEAANDTNGKDKAPAAKPDSDKVGPVLKSLDAVINHLIAAGRGGAPRALLVAGITNKVDATREAISIARALVARREQVVLVDIARGAAVVSGPLELPRAPGLTDLTAGRSGFEDVVRIDADTTLQVIAAGNPKLASGSDENERFTRVFEALMQAYECVVLHADREALRKLAPALKFEIPVVVAVLPAGAGADSCKSDLADFSALGCPVLLYEQSGKEPRSSLFGRVAAV
jgi:hypothetical protein